MSKELKDTHNISSKQSDMFGSSITLPNDVFDQFLAVCEEETQPNKTLLEAATFAKGKGKGKVK